MIAATVFCAAAVLIPLELAREVAANAVVHSATRLTGGVAVGMVFIGWLTFALLPLAAVVLDRDYHRRFGSPGTPVATDTTQLMRRVKARRGHGVARRPARFWLARSPLLVVFALAALFLPLLVAGHSRMVIGWQQTYAGATFLTGWQWSCWTAILGTIIVIMAPVFAGTRPRRARPSSPARVYAAAVALPLIALGISLASI